MRQQRVQFLVLLVLISIVEMSYAQYKKTDWEERDTWMNVPEIFKLAGVEQGNAVADVGCHEGYFTMHLAQKVGESGKVYAVDVREDRIEKLNKYIKDRKLRNIKTVVGDYDNPKLPNEALDVVVVMDTYHEMDDYMKILDHIKNALKQGGRIVIIEKFKKHMLNTSRAEQTEAHTLSLKYVKKELQKAGFLISKEIKDFGKWKNETDKTIWILVGTKNK
ncbi:ubiquinone/menaquinone biosynthesis C-methylase UbiE [Aquimarina sp. EL_43]|uniref:class I SAM-dependent methyltransferase n=1 Tax=unclassified Aquimarina TaxID=2627091 RepID=UPI0018CB093C|nr:MULTISPECIES: class I SAM-dependent methyltransferase [unclassified Aquimarina]MBG6129653.1 ubiquinone/menaquinone biosynthesis C-methylase UbiE [Aquimarina sp. EL_35]MBG6150718.1 ubiquinone/menaquinone biosynthesis C-methylase UbiE [Aquimarina sp. EL_32]MBG6167975.1 ubiquinone/menaquinone biosynthesis C-methylase UbiE [Aquimarina sp. EL_43]